MLLASYCVRRPSNSITFAIDEQIIIDLKYRAGTQYSRPRSNDSKKAGHQLKSIGVAVKSFAVGVLKKLVWFKDSLFNSLQCLYTSAENYILVKSSFTFTTKKMSNVCTESLCVGKPPRWQKADDNKCAYRHDIFHRVATSSLRPLAAYFISPKWLSKSSVLFVF